MEYVEKIISSVGLKFDPEIEILEFHEMVEAKQGKEEEETEPLELNSFEFFAQALLHFEGEANGKLSSTEQSPANPVGSWNKRIEINAQTAIVPQLPQSKPQLCEEVIRSRVNF